MDEADNADVTIQQSLQHQLAAARSGPKIEARGFCLHCEATELPDGTPLGDRRWCCVGCRDDWQKATGAR